MAVSELEQVKQAARAAWGAGDYPSVARRNLWDVGERIVRRVGVAPGEDVLDVACGTGNAAIRAAEAGGRVVGVDLTPKLLEAGERLAAEANVEIDWIEGDAEALPVDDESFDVVLSVFGCMFAPRHDVTAQELARVLRSGGRLGVCAWTPDGYMGEFFRTMGGYMPPRRSLSPRRSSGAPRITSARCSPTRRSSSSSRASCSSSRDSTPRGGDRLRHD